MRLSSFLVKEFKSIIDTGECRLSGTDNILVLAGQNEAGKSAVIEALNFFRNGPSEIFERLQRRQDKDPEVECGFYFIVALGSDQGN
jgi:AAA15 family ATPase/GTPase